MAVRWFQVSLREWFLLVVIASLGVGWWQEHREKEAEQLRRQILEHLETGDGVRLNLFAQGARPNTAVVP